MVMRSAYLTPQPPTHDREKIFLLYSKEIPYSCEVAVTGFKDSDRLLKMNATIFTTRESHLPILIGTKGKGKWATTRLCALRIHLTTPKTTQNRRQAQRGGHPGARGPRGIFRQKGVPGAARQGAEGLAVQPEGLAGLWVHDAAGGVSRGGEGGI